MPESIRLSNAAEKWLNNTYQDGWMRHWIAEVEGPAEWLVHMISTNKSSFLLLDMGSHDGFQVYEYTNENPL